jgi:hypothetical protein
MASGGAGEAASVVEHDIAILQRKIVEFGTRNASGKYEIGYGLLWDKTQDDLEAINGTINAAKKRGIISCEKQMLLKGAHDKVPVVLLIEPSE